MWSFSYHPQVISTRVGLFRNRTLKGKNCQFSFFEVGFLLCIVETNKHYGIWNLNPICAGFSGVDCEEEYCLEN